MKTLHLTTPHDTGRDIEDAQTKLVAAGFLNAVPDGEFGPLTMQACRRAHYWLGFTGDLENAPTYGDKLDALLDDFLDDGQIRQPNARVRAERVAKAKHRKPLGAKALAKAKTQIGTKEIPAGTNHVKYGIWYGADRQPWCAQFVSWCYVQVGSKTFEKGQRYAYVPYVVADAGAGRNSLSLTHDPQPGDLVCFDWEQDGVADHIGLFDTWIVKGKTFSTVEGNTAVGNDSNGGEVMGRERDVSNVARYHGIPAFVHVGR